MEPPKNLYWYADATDGLQIDPTTSLIDAVAFARYAKELEGKWSAAKGEASFHSERTVFLDRRVEELEVALDASMKLIAEAEIGWKADSARVKGLDARIQKAIELHSQNKLNPKLCRECFGKPLASHDYPCGTIRILRGEVGT